MPSTWRNVEIVQEVERGMTEEAIQKVLKCPSIKQYAYILHDEDETRPHYHLLLKFLFPFPNAALEQTCKNAKIVVPDGDGIFQKCHKWSGAIAYLTHTNRPEKHQYPKEQVKTNIPPEEYEELIKESMANVRPFPFILEMIEKDEMVEYNVTSKITPNEYVKYKQQLDTAFRYKNEKGNKEDRDMEVWYIYGKAGAGKTTFAKEICKQIGLEPYISSSGQHPFDDYKGQPVVILDDARPSDWKFNDFLKLTDNNTSSMVGCRYYNKYFYRCQLMIVTNCEPLENWYQGLQEYDNEAIEQLTRRFTKRINVIRTDTDEGIITAFDVTEKRDMKIRCPEVKIRNSKYDLSQYYVS